LNRDRSNGHHDSPEKRESGDLKSEKAANGAATANAGNGAIANEIPDGSDDDLVARRIRKAAEQETDPELKDKLWKEYVEYKKNTHAR
jgi:DNA transposition AAA+ family ATPase